VEVILTHVNLSLLLSLLVLASCGENTSRSQNEDTNGGARPPTSVSANFTEDHRSECSIEAMPSLTDIGALPDPFTTLNGTSVTTLEQWRCRREQIGAMLEHFELGKKPRNPDAVVGSLDGDEFTITVTEGGRSIDFYVVIDKPDGPGPFPAIIHYGRTNLLADALGDLKVATISYLAADIYNADAPNQMAKDGVALRGQGVFYDLYGSDNSAGAMMAWAWGLSRIVDAIAVTPEVGIDPDRLAVTGCSRFGKGALIAGAFDERIKLTIVQEGGSGGNSAWRAISYMKSLGENIEQLSNLTNGSNWFRASFGTTFTDSTVNQIPFDHHQLAGMIAPRALLNVEQDGIAWLGPKASYINNIAAREIFTALSAKQAHTYSLTTAHDHCSLPERQHHWVQSYVRQYLLEEAGEPSAIETPPGYSIDWNRWIDWETPILN